MRPVRLLPLVLLAGLLAPVAHGSATAGSATAAAPVTPTLTAVRAAHHPGFDRIVFDFKGGLPDETRVRYVDQVVADGSGRPVRVAGRARLRVVFEGADAHNAGGATVRKRTTFPLPNVMTAVRASDFEAVLTFGIGLARRTPVKVLTLRDPARVVIDVRAAFRTSQHRVWFFDQQAFLDNEEPFFVPVQRPVPTSRPFVGVLDRLYAGPLPSEHAAGLRLLRSRTTGFTDLRISENGIARVTLKGKCSSGGSTVTVAGSIMPTLRQFPRVDWVKIYSAAGQTADPTGQSDSIPACLEP